MSYANQPRQVIHFGVFEVDLHSAELRRKGMRVRLPGQSFQVLETLISRPGELVTREELQQKLWPADSFGDFEHGLNAAVNRVREALGDSAENPRFVETLPRRGYRFIAPVEPRPANGHHLPESAAPASDALSGPLVASGDGSATIAQFPRGDQRVMLAVLIISSLLCGALLYGHFAKSSAKGAPDSDQDDLRAVPLTTMPGFVASPTFSPDGSQVAFAWDSAKNAIPGTFDLYVKVVGAEHVEQLTHKPTGFIVPAWSPDGRSIAFIRFSEFDSDGGGLPYSRPWRP